MELLPHEVLCIVSQTLITRDIKSLRYVCKYFAHVFSDSHMLDLKGIKLYDHQLQGVKFLLDRESAGLNSILNFDTGTGKTAIILYSYLKNPIPTAIILKKKLHTIWITEMKKYGIQLDIINPTKVTADIRKYKRVIIDEIHEPILHKVNKCDILADHIEGLSVWGITASKITIRKDSFRTHLLKRVFKAPDCIITLKLRELNDTIKSQFKLPNFLLMPRIDYQPIDNANPNHVIVDIIRYYLGNIGTYFRHTYGNSLTYYSYNAFREYIQYYDPPTIVNIEDGSFHLLGRHYTEFDIWELTNMIYKWQHENGMLHEKRTSYKINLLTNYGENRSIVYSDHYSLNYKGPFDVVGAHTNRMTYAARCDAFMRGDISVLMLPSHYSSGFNFGKIDTMIILYCGSYTEFHQMMGRINRLDQQNNTDVYLEVGADRYAEVYREEFV